MNIPTIARLRRIDIRVGVHPDHRNVPPQTFTGGLGGSRDGPHGDGVVAAEGQHEAAFAGVGVDLTAELLGHGGDGAGFLHVAVVRVGGWDEVGVGMDFVVVEDVVFEVGAELVDEAGFDEGHGGGVGAGFAL